jgi:CDP-glucose 4,6-dehydratase
MFGDSYKGKKVLVTGNTGFKGSWLTQWLIALGADVTGISDRVPTTPSLFEVLQLDSKIDHHFLDVRDAEALRSIVGKTAPDFVFHLAAQAIVSESYNDPLNTISTNVIGTANMLEALKSLDKPCTAIIITSDKCYENVEWERGYKETDHLGGKDIYSASKGAAELIIHAYHYSFFKKGSPVRIASVRAGNVIGGGDWALNRIVPDCFRAWANEKPVEIRNPKSTRPWQHVLEPLSGYLRMGQQLANDAKYNGEAYNFGPHAQQDETVLEVLETLATHWDFKNMKEKFVYDKNSSFHEAALLKLDCEKAKEELQWESTLEFKQTIALTAKWYNRYYNSDKASIADFTLEQINEYVAAAKQKNQSWTK